MKDLLSKACKILAVFFLFISLQTGSSWAGQDKTLALLPLAMYVDESKAYLRQGIESMFTSRLSGSGMSVISGQALAGQLNEQDKKGVLTEARAGELGRNFKADYVIFGSLTSLGPNFSLDLSMLDLTKELSPLTRISETVTEDQLIPKLSDLAYRFRSVVEGKEFNPQTTASAPVTQGPPSPQGPGGFFKPVETQSSFSPTSGIPLKLDIEGFDLGDIDHDGQSEWFVLTRGKLLVYNRNNEILSIKTSLKTSFGESYLKLSVGTVDQNGKAGLFLVSQYGQSARTTVYEWSGDKLKKTAQMDGHLRVLKNEDQKGNLVIYQDSAAGRFFYGKIFVMKYQADKWIKDFELKLPKEARFYTLGVIDINQDSIMEFTGIGSGLHPYIWNRDGQVVWQGDDTAGGTNNAIRLKQQDTLSKDEIRFEIESPMIVLDMDRDGKKELLTIKNIPASEYLPELGNYSESHLIAYRIEGSNLIKAWNSKDIPYCMMDMATDGKILYLAVAKNKMLTVTSGTSRILWFE